MVLFAAIYHWVPKVPGKHLHDGLSRFHFWITFLGTYAVYLPMHYLGFLGVPRRYFAMGDTAFIPESAQTLNSGITVAALIVGVGQLFFIYNVIISLRNGKKAEHNPWGATTLEWQTPDTPQKHGNWGPQLPEVHRWAYDYSVPNAKYDFIPQNQAEADVEYLDPNQEPRHE